MAGIYLQDKEAPRQDTMLGIAVEEQVWITFPGVNEKEEFMRDHVSLKRIAMMLLCPVCCAFVPLVSKKRSIEYAQECGICSCPYNVSVDGQQVARARSPGCCENGTLFCLCPACTCGGHAKLMSMEGRDGVGKFMFARKLFPCWPYVTACAAGCAPCGLCCVGLDGCVHYCEGTEIKSVTQPVFKGDWSRGGGEPQRVGQFVLTQRYTPRTCCCAMPTPLKLYYEPEGAGQKVDADERVALSLALQLYRGLPVPCGICSPPAFRAPVGIPCLDVGLMTTVKWSSVQEAMKRSG